MGKQTPATASRASFSAFSRASLSRASFSIWFCSRFRLEEIGGVNQLSDPGRPSVHNRVGDFPSRIHGRKVDSYKFAIAKVVVRAKITKV